MAARVRVNFRRPCSWCPRQRWQIAAVNANNSHHSFQVFFNKSDKPFNATASCWDQLTSRMSLPSNKSRLWDDPSTFNDVFNNYWFGVSILTEVKKCENGGIGTTITIRQFDSKENVIKKRKWFIFLLLNANLQANLNANHCLIFNSNLSTGSIWLCLCWLRSNPLLSSDGYLV